MKSNDLGRSRRFSEDHGNQFASIGFEVSQIRASQWTSFLRSIYREFVAYSEPPPLSEDSPSREGRVEMEMWGRYIGGTKDGKQGAETKARARAGGGGMQFYQKYSEYFEGLLLAKKRQKMKDIRDWPSHSAASLPRYGFILLFRFYSVRL